MQDRVRTQSPVAMQDEITLYDFLNGLSPEQQRAALIHLSVNWAQNQAGEKANEQS